MRDEEARDSLLGSLVPKSLVGLAMALVLFSAGMAASGVVLFAYYQHKLNVVEQSTQAAREELNAEFKRKSKELNQQVVESKAEIERASKGIGAQTNEVNELLAKVGKAIAHVQGTDAAGAPSSGSGFVVTTNSNESWVITNFRILAGSAAAKTPVRVRLGNADREGTVWTWDDRRDLALVIIKTGNLAIIEWSPTEPQVGSVVWSVGAASGKQGAAASKGHVIDASSDGILVDSEVPASSAGGPVLTKDGKVIGVLTIAYAPDGFAPSSGWAVPIRLSCQKVLRCPS